MADFNVVVSDCASGYRRSGKAMLQIAKEYYKLDCAVERGTVHCTQVKYHSQTQHCNALHPVLHIAVKRTNIRHLLIYLLTYLFTYLLHCAESFLRN